MNGIGEAARLTPDAPAVIEPHRVWSHAEIDDRMRRVAGSLLSAGIRRGDRIAVWAGNRREVVEVVGGALRAGIVPVPINPLSTPAEARYLLEDSGASWLFSDRHVEPGAGLGVVTFGDAFERTLHQSSPAEVADVVLGRPMHYTSGTTGRPKGVWVDPAPEEIAAARSQAFRRLWSIAPEDRHLVCSPLAHSAPLRFALRTLESGGAVSILGRFDARSALAAIDLFSVTSTFMVPTHLERIVSLGRTGLTRHDLSSLRWLAHAGAPIRRVTKDIVMASFPEETVWEFYGATEGQATRISTAEWVRKPGSVGRPNPGAQIFVRDDAGHDLAAGETGEIWIDDPGAERFRYWNDPEKTDAAWRGSAFTVGDLGYVDADGYLFLVGRKHDVIITGGVNVYPQEVEAVLAGHPSVADAIVYGAPDDEWGQRVEAAVVTAPGRELIPDEVRAWVRARVAAFKVPRRIVVLDEIPRTPTGKPRRTPPGG
ncbi:MAG TPA: AMP-binding protein [Actinomycetota bacterium]|jgi:long-chain acyl-CoA synthetase|nr:AMP-binding protein [Actinomycetota bacterium]